MGIIQYQVDAFASRPFTGNPAAVCLLESWPDDGLLQAIAAENNLSETAFLVARGDRYHLRWFTPLIEVDLCGHATLASAYVVFEFLKPGSQKVAFDTRSGELRVWRADGLLQMDFPSLPPTPCECPPSLAEGLGRTPMAVLRSSKYLAVFESEDEVRTLAPKMDRLAELDRIGVIVTAPGDEADFVSRFFAPQVGVPEDPVTGSAHSVLTPYWAERLGKSELEARQISRRGGALQCRLQGDRVLIGGRAALFMKGEICL